MHRFGGWGHLINDDGSGYTIACKAIRFIAYSFDTNAEETMLKREIFSKLGIAQQSSAALVPVVEECAKKGDPQAQEILRWAGERLAMLAVGLCQQYNEKQPLYSCVWKHPKKDSIRPTCLLRFFEPRNRHLYAYNRKF